ncbi:Crp/Fnr family transcriptional regulator [Algoriphagus antarcticus]|uniref:Crp/Fnr family transcriptional regulator n=1 Tax=Algoriphagus antarcticus TaxID=238540 RepID=UPI000A386326
MYFLQKGKIKISKVSDTCKEKILGIQGPGEIFGELVLAVENSREDLAIAKEDAVICKVNQERFKELMAKNSDLNFPITKFIGPH